MGDRALVLASIAAILRFSARPANCVGRFLQSAGGVFALVGAIYIATTGFPPQTAFTPLLYGVALAIVLVLLLKETGPVSKEVSR